MAVFHTPPTGPSSSAPQAKGVSLRHRGIPTAFVLAGLIVLAYWGHQSDWRFFLAPPSHNERPTEVQTRWVEAGPQRQSSTPCADHKLPECPACNPEAAQLSKRPTVAAEQRDRFKRAIAVRERDIGDPSVLKLPRLIRFSSAEAVDASGIDITPAWTESVTEVVGGSGELGFDPALYTRLTARAPGSAWRVFKRIGDLVRKGDLLALVDAAEVGKAKADLQIALVQVRLKSQAARDLATTPVQQRQRREAEAAMRVAEIRLVAAEQALVNLGLSPRISELRTLSPAGVAENLQRLNLPSDLSQPIDGVTAPGTLLPVVAPRDGVVMRADVVAGEPVDTRKVLFVVADPRQLRLTLHIRPNETRWAKLGQTVHFRPDGATSDVTGRVTWVGVNADETTRTVPIWAELANRDGKLRASTLGTGRIVLREESDAVVIPARAIQMVEGVPVVFVRDKDYFTSDAGKAFHVRVVVVGAHAADNVEVIAGLFPGEVVASKGSEVLADELRKGLAAEQ